MGNLSSICEDKADKRKKWDDIPDEKIFQHVSITKQVKSYGDLVRGQMTFSVARNYKDVEALSLYLLFSSIINFLMLIHF